MCCCDVQDVPLVGAVWGAGRVAAAPTAPMARAGGGNHHHRLHPLGPNEQVPQRVMQESFHPADTHTRQSRISLAMPPGVGDA